ncbi:activator-dependent family glycosyltransferase [Micromonospora aurantiaca]|uniref:activator-dependent family glycosyltransferase n=1 Tax=Micromonospora aurantiaca (nom. illeg.) TaxID=47850 RepID=UPI0033FDAE93
MAHPDPTSPARKRRRGHRVRLERIASARCESLGLRQPPSAFEETFMRVLFTTFAAPSHLQIQVPIAWALRAAGHDVRIAGQPDLADAVARTGHLFVPVGEPLALSEQIDRPDDGSVDFTALADLSCRRPDRRTREYLRTALAISTDVYRALNPEPMITQLVDLVFDWRPDLVVWDTMTFGGAVAAMAGGAAHARLLFGLDLIARARMEYRRHDAPDDPFRDWLGSALDKYGVAFAEEAVVGQWTIDPVPPSVGLATDQLRVPVRYVPYNGAATATEMTCAPAHRPRVCLTLGQSGRDVLGRDRAASAELLAAAAEIDAEIVATLDARQLAGLGPVPSNVRVVDFMALDVLLPTCSAIINHGGSGSMQTALLHGVPQVVVPDLMWDTEYKAELIERAGAGVWIRDPDFPAPALAAAVRRVLIDPSYREAAARLRREVLGAPTPADIVPALELLTEQHRRPVTAGPN